MRRLRYRQLAHTADSRLAVWGGDGDELVRNAVAAALAVALGRPPGGPATAWRPVPSRSRSLPATMVAAVNQALFLLYARREVTVATARRRGRTVLGTRPLATARELAVEVKAATFHNLGTTLRAGRLRVTLTLDL